MLRTLSSAIFPLLRSMRYTPIACCRGSITVNICDLSAPGVGKAIKSPPEPVGG